MNLGQIVPQIVYDLIGRIIPGLSLLGTSYFLWSSDIQRLKLAFFTDYKPSELALSLILLLLAYILSLGLEGLWRLLCSRWFQKLVDQPSAEEAREGVVADFTLVDKSFNRFDYRFPGIPVIYDIIRLLEPAAGARLVKLRAELQLCRIFMLGWSIMFAAILLDFTIRTSSEARRSAALVLPIIVVAFLAEYKKLQVRTAWSIYNHWLLLVNPGVGILTENRSRVQSS
jgi:hypothetical protein